MRLIETLNSGFQIPRPLAITIGNFDGIHLGHQAVLSHLRSKVLAQKGKTLVISFSNHPVEVLQKSVVIPKLCTNEHKIKLLDQFGIDYLILIPFTIAFSRQTAEEFLLTLMSSYPFDDLVLGDDAVLGKDKEGNQKKIILLSKKLGFRVEYVKQCSINEDRISSRKIRNAITSGDLQSAEKMLGRPYSIYSALYRTETQNQVIINAEGLCLPPSADYPIQLKTGSDSYEGSCFIDQGKIFVEINSPHPVSEDLGELLFMI